MTIALVSASATLIVAFLTQFVAEKYRRFNDATALAAGILGELSAYKGGAEKLRPRITGWMEMAQAGEVIKMRPFDRPVDVYFDAVVEKIGLLGPDLTQHIVYVYANLRAFRLGLEIIAKFSEEMASEELIARCTLCLESLERADQRGKFLEFHLQARCRMHFFESYPKVPRPSASAM